MLDPHGAKTDSKPPAPTDLATAAPPVGGWERRTFDRRGVTSLQLDALESERQRIARELHDELGQRLSAAKLMLAEVSRAASPHGKLTEGLEDLGKVLDDSVEAVRQLARDLRPPMLDDLGLNSALESLATGTASRLGIRIELQLDADPQLLDSSATIAVYRIAQESLTNVARHARARHVRIESRLGSASWLLQVEDDGVGMAQREPAARHTLGLVGMRERAHLLGGRLRIEPAPGGGTRVCLELPLEQPIAALAREAAPKLSALTFAEIEHERAVHQLALESQNGELRRAQVELSVARDRYLDLYDFAPVGYLTIDHGGVIVEANVTAASLLAVPNGALIRKPFSEFVVKRDIDRWLHHASHALGSEGSQSVEVMLQPARGVAFQAQLDCVRSVHDMAEPMLRATLSDVSAREQATMSRRIALRAVDEAEAERKRLASALHEDLAQDLSVLKMDLARLLDTPSPFKSSISIGKMIDSTDHALSKVRRIAMDLRPPILDDLGLNAAVNWLALDVATRTGVAIKVHHDDNDPPLDAFQRVGVFRLLQIALSLITRSAAGQSATIHLRHGNGQLELLMESSGSGWPMGDSLDMAVATHSPLVQQVHLLGGRLEFEDSIHQSRRVAFRLRLPSGGEPSPAHSTT